MKHITEKRKSLWKTKLEGTRFGTFHVIKFSGYHFLYKTKKGLKQSKWLCQCDCGAKRLVFHRGVTGKKWVRCKHCGTKSKGDSTQKAGCAGLNNIFEQYESYAKRRGNKFNLTKDQVKHITSQNCYYCGTPPKQKSWPRYKGLKNRNKKYLVYWYNGIDRKNSDLGYSVKNCVPCCKTCNYFKRDMELSEFMAHIKKITTHTKGAEWS